MGFAAEALELEHACLMHYVAEHSHDSAVKHYQQYNNIMTNKNNKVCLFSSTHFSHYFV